VIFNCVAWVRLIECPGYSAPPCLQPGNPIALAEPPGKVGRLLRAMGDPVPRVPHRILQREKRTASCDPFRCLLEEGHIVRNMVKYRHAHEQGITVANLAQCAIGVVDRLEIGIRTEPAPELVDGRSGHVNGSYIAAQGKSGLGESAVSRANFKYSEGKPLVGDPLDGSSQHFNKAIMQSQVR
jgi:hypothetical protein